jgi:hypothetical protein
VAGSCGLQAARESPESAAENRRDQALIANECAAIRDFLLEKNRRYGSSALRPRRLFSRANAIEQINVRIDDKLSRIEHFPDGSDEDTELDLIGYLILKRVARQLQEVW